MTPDAATLRQIEAADPKASTWLSANAGSGKTKVLTDRVARLLLDGVAPQNILCLTYTKAAASEMQNRLFQRLGEWAMKPDAALENELRKLGVETPIAADRLARARTLFARALETPGGLRIQTIHSFCSSILRRFPLEAGVTPFFTEIEERAQQLLFDDVIEEIASGPDRNVIEAVAEQFTGEDLSSLAREIAQHRHAFAEPQGWTDHLATFDAHPGVDEQAILRDVFLGGEDVLLRDLSRAMAASDKISDQKAAGKVPMVGPDGPTLSVLETLFGLLLTGSGAKEPFTAKIGKFPTKDARSALGARADDLDDLMQRVEDARQPLIALRAARKRAALYDFAVHFLTLYEQHKSERGQLDFDDLITRAHRLLSDPAVAQWVLFRLDGGIDHILVDEAQDTSPAQWAVIELLAQEFTAGEGARSDLTRTIFVVGDLKQSIYSFQGADPNAFDQMREHFAGRLAAVDQHLAETALEHSFRSSHAILGLVDATFKQTGGRGVGGIPTHEAYRANLPGRVDLWPLIEKTDPPEDADWFDPVDRVHESDHRVVLAEHIAAQIQDIVGTAQIPDKQGNIRPARFGDVLILVQRRSELFHQIIRACKALNLPIAGADRLKIGGELAVRDLCALLAFLDLPQDDLSLAAVLRSPLFGLTEDDLFRLSHGRAKGQLLWDQLYHARENFAEAVRILTDLRSATDFQSPYTLLETILTRHGGRLNLLARLGPEAEEGIDALLSQALAYERAETPSLTGFLTWMDSGEAEVKRQPDSAGDRIRVMTTHGAKGLEAPIVILPDTADRRQNHSNQIIAGRDTPVMWRISSDQQPEAMRAALAQAAEAQEEERMRLLYVAVTRAQTWLIVCASGTATPGKDSWYRTVEAGMRAFGAHPQEFAHGPGLRFEHGEWPDPAPKTEDTLPKPLEPLPAWATSPAPAGPDPLKTVSPSDLDPRKSLPGETDTDEAAALRYGSLVHALLETLPGLPRETWPARASEILTLSGLSPTDVETAAALSEATETLTAPDLQFIFAENSLAEVPVTASVPALGPDPLFGAIDRLVITKDEILIIDFKTNRILPDTPQDIPPGITLQLAAYAAALSQIYPDRPVSCAVLWTRTAELMRIPHDIVSAALQRPATS